jgi:hypothetical protein
VARISAATTQVTARSGAVQVTSAASPSMSSTSTIAPFAADSLGKQIYNFAVMGLDAATAAADAPFMKSYTDRSGTQTIRTGDQVLFSPAKWQSVDKPALLSAGERVRLLRSLTGADPAVPVYEYVGATPLSNVDFEAQDYSDTSLWQKARGDESTTYIYFGSEATLDLARWTFSTRPTGSHTPLQSRIKRSGPLSERSTT